ncbi:hypothetical protein [uncultured Rikenella sp.]|nr:hypothetical protein [uncultured Rikenella sp.]
MGVGRSGYSWSRTKVVFLTFSIEELTPSSTTNRAFGVQLRCLSE